MGNFLRHPLTVAVAVGIIAPIMVASIVVFVRTSFRLFKTLTRLEELVIPHFETPKPGMPDNSMPGRMARLEDQVITHMQNEELQRIADVQERRETWMMMKNLADQVGSKDG